MKQKKVEQFIKKHQLLEKGSVIVVGVSGGPDSIALLHYLWSVKDRWSLTIIAAHVDHMFRGKESYEDLLFVQSFCRNYQIPFAGISIDVPTYMKEHHMSSQVAARTCRYEFYKEVIEAHRANYLALAHHGDDQVETMLMRMVRGSYGQALAGIPVKRSFGDAVIIRPFLCLTKDDIEQYIKENNLSFREDPSNKKDDYQRNRFRHHILPLLKKENPNVSERFQTISEMLTEDQQLLEEEAKQELQKVILEKSDTKINIHIEKFVKIPIPLQRRAIHLILKYLYKQMPADIATVHIHQVLSLFKNQHPSGRLNFPNGLIVTRSYQECTFAIEKESDRNTLKSQILTVPGEVFVDAHHSIKAEWVSAIPEKIGNVDFFICNANDIALPLYIRHRKTGDRMTLKGMKGTKKIKDIFIDEKIPRQKRDAWPVVTDANDQILWLPSLKKSAFFNDKPKEEKGNSHHYLLLTYITYNKYSSRRTKE